MSEERQLGQVHLFAPRCALSEPVVGQWSVKNLFVNHLKKMNFLCCDSDNIGISNFVFLDF